MTNAANDLMSLVNRMAAACDQVGERIPGGAFFVNRWVELSLVALAYTGVLVAAMKITRLNAPIHRCGRQITAAAYEILLFRHSVRAVVTAELRLLGWNLRCTLCLLPVLALGFLAFHIMSGSLKNRYAYRPIDIVEPFVIQFSGLNARALHTANEADEAGDGAIMIDAMVCNEQLNTVWAQVHSEVQGIHGFGSEISSRDACLNVDSLARPAQPRQRAGEHFYRISYPVSAWWGDRHGWMWTFGVLCIIWAWPLNKAWNAIDCSLARAFRILRRTRGRES